MSADRTFAIDVALLLPEHVATRAVALNCRLSSDRRDHLRLDDTHLPHITLVQQFVDPAKLPALLARVEGISSGQSPLELSVRGITCGTTVTLDIERSAPLLGLHESLMATLAALEEPGGDESSFLSGGEKIRRRDVEWVARYRHRSSLGCYQPHITVGHGDLDGPVEAFDFVADRLAVCHLGRHCTCRAVLREWRLRTPPRTP